LPDGNTLPDLPDLDLPEVAPLKVPDELKGDASKDAEEAPGEMTLPATDAAPAGEAKPTEEAKPTDRSTC
jgi:hypothetical protein